MTARHGWFAAALMSGILTAHAADPSAAGLLGTWKLEQKSMMASGTMYATFTDGGACTQVIMIKAFGTTHWGVDRCSWSLQQSQLSMKIVSSPTQPDKVGEANAVTITSLTSDALVITAKDKTQNWSRVPAMPADFAAEFQKAYAQKSP